MGRWGGVGGGDVRSRAHVGEGHCLDAVLVGGRGEGIVGGAFVEFGSPVSLAKEGAWVRAMDVEGMWIDSGRGGRWRWRRAGKRCVRMRQGTAVDAYACRCRGARSVMCEML